YHQWKIIPNAGSWDVTYPASNMKIKYGADGTSTIHFTPGTITDGWFPLQNRVGFDDPANMSWEVAGDFTTPTWDTDPAAQMTLVGNGVYSVSYVIPTAGTHQFKFRSSGSWDMNMGADSWNSGGNASVTTTGAMQVVEFQLDLPNGRWLAGEPAPAPITNQIVFAVDMSVEQGLNRFDPATDTAFVSGAFNGWPGTGAGALVLTNDPPWNGNTNIYYGTNTVVGLPAATYAYKFTDNNPSLSGQSGYESLSADRSLTLLSTNGVLVLPVVVFGDAVLSDYLDKDMWVTFTVNLTNAVTSTNSSSNINSPEGMNTPHTFDPMNDTVIINGDFLSGGWLDWQPISLYNNVMTNNPPDSQIVQFTYFVAKGSRVQIHYKYGMRYASNPSTNNILDNEAPTYQDHVRYIRSTASGHYEMPLDTFGDQHVEPSFGQLAAGPASGGKVALSWLGRPGVWVQTRPSLTTGSWTDYLETDGTNWSAGSNSPDGLLSATNWPATGESQFFRLIKR
ncbi:MAG: hypothetical protein ACTHKU_05010, partial [Verrucomicrobiota bacterium]